MRMRQPSEAERDTLSKLVLGLTRDVLDAAERVDVDAAFRYHSAQPDAAFLIDGKSYTRQSLVEAYRTIYAGVDHQEIEFGTPSAIVVSDRTVVVTSTGRYVTKMKNGASFARNAAWTYVWVKDGESWNIRHVHQSFPEDE
jgi:hypothetical protein